MVVDLRRRQWLFLLQLHMMCQLLPAVAACAALAPAAACVAVGYCEMPNLLLLLPLLLPYNLTSLQLLLLLLVVVVERLETALSELSELSELQRELEPQNKGETAGVLLQLQGVSALMPDPYS